VAQYQTEVTESLLRMPRELPDVIFPEDPAGIEAQFPVVQVRRLGLLRTQKRQLPAATVAAMLATPAAHHAVDDAEDAQSGVVRNDALILRQTRSHRLHCGFPRRQTHMV
jgi:hypothetical protein